MEDKEHSKKYRKTINGVISTIYNNQIGHSKTRGHNPPEYSKKQFREWILSDEKFYSIYNDRVFYGYKRSMSVSVDRLDDDKGYSFDNIRLVVWKENDKKQVKKRRRPIVGVHKDTGEIKRYNGLRKAGRETGIDYTSIVRCCKGQLNHAGGFIWKYI